MNVIDVARIAHEANRALCTGHGDFSQPSFEAAPEWQRASAINGVIFHLANPEATPEQSHENWLREKEADGWRYGPEKIPEQRLHPCMRPYAELPAEQRAKDHLFRAIVHGLAPFVSDGAAPAAAE